MWPPDRDKWFPGFTPHRDGWVRKYHGRTIFCGGKSATRDGVERRWREKCALIDESDSLSGSPRRSYREVLSEYLAHCKRRVDTGKPRPMARRTLSNYAKSLNAYGRHVGGGTEFALTNDPARFAAFAAQYGHWRASAYDSLIVHVGTFYAWAAGMEYIDRARFGPGFVRPSKGDIRQDRLIRTRSYTPAEFATLYHAAGPTMRLWMMLGIAAAFIPSDVVHLPTEAVDLTTGTIDYRRRKTGRVRRVVVLPVDVAQAMRDYRRPAPSSQKHAGLFFLNRNGQPYSVVGNSVSRLWWVLTRKAGVGKGKGFSGLRTTFYNACPSDAYQLERQVIMGRARGSVDLDHYLESVDPARLAHLSDLVWSPFRTALSAAQM